MAILLLWGSFGLVSSPSDVVSMGVQVEGGLLLSSAWLVAPHDAFCFLSLEIG
jgi:hypothetical protein